MVPVVVVVPGSFLVGPGQEKAISAKRFQLTFLEVEGDAFYLYVSQAEDKQSVILYLFIFCWKLTHPEGTNLGSFKVMIIYITEKMIPIRRLSPATVHLIKKDVGRTYFTLMLSLSLLRISQQNQLLSNCH